MPPWHEGRTLAQPSTSSSGAEDNRGGEMILATTKVEDFDRFMKIFSTKGAEKREQHGSKGSHVFRDSMTTTGSGCRSTGMRRAGKASSPTPTIPAILQEAGHKGKPHAAELAGTYDA